MMYRSPKPYFEKCSLLTPKMKLKHVCICIGLILLLDYFGAFTHMFEITYNPNFVYPYQVDVHEFVQQLRHNQKPTFEPMNVYNYSILIENSQKCVDAAYKTFRIVYIVKSAVENFERRSVIRSSWGFEKRFFDVPSKTIFVLGTHPHDSEIQAKVKIESGKYKDIVQADFMDAYYNNTIKTMTSFKWLVNHCSNSKFYMFVDDDMYVSIKNVLRFIRNPANYPDYLKEPKKFDPRKREIKDTDKDENTNDSVGLHKDKTIVEQKVSENTAAENLLSSNRRKRQIFDFELPDDVRLFAGYVFVSSPHRHKSSKWYVPLSEYPYHLWPPYVSAGAYILSREALLDMYYTSLYTKHFRFDDTFLGLVAKKADIEPFHCEEFHFYKKDYTKYSYKYVVASHGYGDPSELLHVWNEQKAMGNA